MTQREARRAAAELVARRVAGIDIAEVLAAHPDRRDAERVHEALGTAEMELEWRDPLAGTKVRAIAVVASPLVIPLLAVGWLAWRMKGMMISVRRVWGGGSGG